MKVALIGYGYWGQVLAKYLEADQDFDLQFIYTQKAFIPKATLRIEDMIENGTEAVFIATPTATHYQLSKKFLEAGIHVFCEKPFTNPKEVSELVALAGNAIFHVNYIYNNSPSIQLMKEWLPRIGTIKAARFSIQQYGRFYANENSFETIGCHLIAVYCNLFQPKNTQWSLLSSQDGHVQNLFAKDADFPVHIHSSLMAARKCAEIELIGSNGNLLYAPQSSETLSYFSLTDTKTLMLEDSVCLDEKNNIIHAFEEFKKQMSGQIKGDNAIAVSVAEILNDIKHEQAK